ncbi:sulfotransferase family protein [Prochlorothrix hollandica]|uniref:Sulfotransferase n=1 Tax=Prochlorothrix hollandica PCC 9006 = CALU 1027 TaxID=317619 RepID=A0A0M2PXE1_PROHO|nr:sulfotransferase [Prochlorothrix hollandica]KKI99328.1 hypothetical protein PROH_16615 [Prochlorothrix hollandica PCC 9006 = CALU 1027]
MVPRDNIVPTEGSLAMAASKPQQTVVFILGTAHSGSTLLSLILGSHPQAFAVGELSNLPDFFDQGRSICDICESNCDFWQGRFSRQELQRLTACLWNQRLHPAIPLSVERQVRSFLGRDQIFRPYSQIFAKLPGDPRLIVDSTKTLYWIRQQLKLPEFKAPWGRSTLQPKLLHLVRDGRAVLASTLRRQPQTSVASFSRKWLQRIQESEAFFAGFPVADRYCLRYEDLATDPQATLQHLGQFLGLTMTEDQLRYWENDHHFISGNTGTRSLIMKYRQKYRQSSPPKAPLNLPASGAATPPVTSTTPTPAHPEPHTPGDRGTHGPSRAYNLYAEEVGFQIKLDLRWHRELSAEHLETFQRLTGTANAPYAWDPP